jgi:fatty acid desaturase
MSRAVAIQAAAPIPVAMNMAIAATLIFAHLFALIALPIIHLAVAWDAIVLLALALASHLLWALIHDAIHGVLLRTPTSNDALGRALSLCFGAPFRPLRFAHLRHHRYNRSEFGREEVYDRAKTSKLVAYAAHYARITCGLYVGEVALNSICWLPRDSLRRVVRRACSELQAGAAGAPGIVEREVLAKGALAQIRLDAACVLAAYGTSFFLYGSRWSLLLMFLTVRALVISQLDHAPHHGTPLARRDDALNMTAPRWLQAALLNFNLHRTHHQNPRLPWSSLPAKAGFAESDISFLRAVARQWRGPISLEDAQRSPR